MKANIATSLTLAVMLSACASAPKPLQGQFASLLPSEASLKDATNEVVRWGGRIVKVEPQANHSCFEIVSARLDSRGRPRHEDRSDGRFIACRNGFYDPEVFQPGREITVSGKIEGGEIRKVGDFDYRYARIAADVIYLWPERKDVEVRVIERPHHFGWWW